MIIATAQIHHIANHGRSRLQKLRHQDHGLNGSAHHTHRRQHPADTLFKQSGPDGRPRLQKRHPLSFNCSFKFV
jgi:hypothetical protein